MFKGLGRLIRRVAIVIGVAALVYLGIVAVLTLRTTSGHQAPPALPPVGRLAGKCGAGRDPAAAANAQSRATLAVAPFATAETGWQVYEPLIAREIGTDCPGDTAAFAAGLGAWQTAHGIAASGRIDTTTLNRLALVWLQRRPFIAAMRHGCPPSPNPARLVMVGASEAYGGKTILARPGALAAYRRMVATARQDGIAPPHLAIASAWRGPDEELARCADGGCGTAARARCSAHRTGLAFDFVLGDGSGNDGFSTAPANRLALSRTPSYRWLVANAGSFGFVNYPFEPWHWEWIGENI